MRERGGQIQARSTGIGIAFSCSVDTSASPTPSSEITRATSSFGFGTKVSAAVFTDFMRGSSRTKDLSSCLASFGPPSSGTL